MRPSADLALVQDSGFAGSTWRNGGFLAMLIEGTLTVGCRVGRATATLVPGDWLACRGSVRDGTMRASSSSSAP